VNGPDSHSFCRKTDLTVDSRPGVPNRHGMHGDPRYPSPRRLRRATAFAIDWLLHIGVAIGLSAVCEALPELAPWSFAAAVSSWIAVSFVHRTVLQSVFHATAGKALCGLCILKPDGSWPGFGFLTKWWVIGTFSTVLVAVSGAGGDSDTEDDWFPPVVRLRDVRRLHVT